MFGGEITFQFTECNGCLPDVLLSYETHTPLVCYPPV